MDLRTISISQKNQYNKLVSHIIQSWEWGQARENLGTKVLRYGLFKNGKLYKAFQLTLHPIPFTKSFVGYLPKGPVPDKELSDALIKIGKENNCAFIKIEPDVVSQNTKQIPATFHSSPKPLFTKYNFVIDLTKSEDELLKNMSSKTRYNIKVAQKHAVKVEEKLDDKSFKTYLKLYFETTARQQYHGHNQTYHQKIWETLKNAGMAKIVIANYKKESLTAWELFIFKDTIYYPFGGSSKSHPEVMANNLVCWEVIKLGKKLGLKK